MKIISTQPTPAFTQGNPNPPFYIGVDIAKRELVVDLAGKSLSFDNSPDGLLRLLAHLRPFMARQPHLVLEASGGYERRLLLFAWQHGLAVSLVQARRVRRFAEADGLNAKTDAIDAALLTRFGFKMEPERCYPPEGLRAALEPLLARRAHLLKALVAESHHASSTQGDNPLLEAQNQQMMTSLKHQVKALDEAIAKTIQQDTQLQQMDALLQSVKSVGPQTSRMLIASLPELGRVSRGEISTLAGLTPFNDDSGKRQGKRFIKGGRSAVRKVLYMAAIVASRHNEVLRAVYQRLRLAGKPGKVAIIAVSRKLLCYLNSLATQFYKNNDLSLAS